MNQHVVFDSWKAVFDAPRSQHFKSDARETATDRATKSFFIPSTEPLFTQSNARVLLGHNSSGVLRFVALPIQIYPAPTRTPEFGLGPGMYHHFDVAMYVGDLTYQVEIDEQQRIDLTNDDRDNTSCYLDHYLPYTRADERGIEASLLSFAPVAADAERAPLAPAPLPGPSAAIYVLHLRNTRSTPVQGKVILQASDQLINSYNDLLPPLRDMKRPQVDVHQHCLILTRPFGAVGIHLHNGQWTETQAPFQAECAFALKPGEERLFETYVSLGSGYAEIMPTIFELHLHSALDWLNKTAEYWRSRLGQLEASGEEGSFSRDIYIRSLFDNFNCLQTDSRGELIAHWQGAPSHGYGTIWGIDVEPTAVSIVNLCPEIARQTMRFFMTRSRVPKGTADHSTPILVAPIIVARQWLQATGDVGYLTAHPDVMEALEGIMCHLLALESPKAALFPTRYSSDGPVGRRYDYATNVKVWYAFDSMAYLLRALGQADAASAYASKADAIRAAVYEYMVADGPLGRQISGGTNLGEVEETFYLPDGVLYYDGEDTGSMLAPIYGFCELDDETWINYHRFARSLWCPSYDPEFEAVLWNPSEPGVVDGTSYFSQLGGSVTQAEMRESLAILREWAVDEGTGSVFWWPHGKGNKRALTRCSQGQGAWAWQYLTQWLGLQVDALERKLTLAPRGLLTDFRWMGFRVGEYCFDIRWSETDDGNKSVIAEVRNRNELPWTVEIGFRAEEAGAQGLLIWKTYQAAAGEAITGQPEQPPVAHTAVFGRTEIMKRAVQTFSRDCVIFKRYGPAILWANWLDWSGFRLPDVPLALRFLVGNHTSKDWNRVSVTITSTDGWWVEERPSGVVTRPDRRRSATACVQMGALPSGAKSVAAFWLTTDKRLEFFTSWNIGRIPFQAASQPGAGITLFVDGLREPLHTSLSAVLTATATDGAVIGQTLTIPVAILAFASESDGQR